MGRKRTPGLRFRAGVWHIEKRICGVPVYESTGSGSLAEAEQYLARRTEQIRAAKVYGERPRRTWRDAATKYLEEKVKRSLADDAAHLERLDPFIGGLALHQVHDGTLEPFIRARRAEGVKARTVNAALAVVRHILHLAARRWRDEHGLTWLETPPLITLLPLDDAAKPYPLDWDEQARLFQALPEHVAEPALYAVNVGGREQEIVGLRWDWEVPVPELGLSVFLVPATATGRKVGEEHVQVPNSIARNIIERRRSLRPAGHDERCDSHQGEDCNCTRSYVFGYRGLRLAKLHTSAWKRAWKAARLPTGPEWKRGVHNLRHTCGRRLRAAGVPNETRKVILGHTTGDITSHYSAAELQELVEAVEKLTQRDSGNAPALHLLKREVG
ncbi:MAG TPA: tyrosine-type recombinase/integrase [Gammaproteobacteria bacterium]|nr:tyrosine-type recombinase/integrase [Gammaproteobacteria bacterium]